MEVNFDFDGKLLNLS